MATERAKTYTKQGVVDVAVEDGVEVAEEPVAGRVVAAGAEVEAAEEGRDPACRLGRRRVDEHALLVVRVQRPHHLHGRSCTRRTQFSFRSIKVFSKVFVNKIFQIYELFQSISNQNISNL